MNPLYMTSFELCMIILAQYSLICMIDAVMFRCAQLVNALVHHEWTMERLMRRLYGSG